MPTRASAHLADDTHLVHAGESAACTAFFWGRIGVKSVAESIADMLGYENTPLLARFRCREC